MLQIQHLLPSSADTAAGLARAATALAAAQSHTGLNPQLQVADGFRRGSRSAALVAAAFGCDLVHSHGLWLSPSVAVRHLASSGTPAVIAPHGMLDPWALRHHGLRKRLIWRLRERHALESVHCLQALCSAECDAIRAMGLQVPIALIPNGVELPERSASSIAALPPAPWAGSIPEGAAVLLFLGRFHAKKGLVPLLIAWQQLQAALHAGSERPWLVLAGFGDGGALERQLQRRPIPGVLHVGPLYGPAKASAYAHAQGFVLPSFSEGLPMAALEALSWGLPCLLSPACNLPEAFTAGAAWPAPPDPDQLLPVLQRWANASTSSLAAMGSAGRNLAATRFSWPQVAAKTADLYRWLIGGGEPPNSLCQESASGLP